MEEKQLNFNQPLLSVRRFSSTVASQKDSTRENKSSLPTIPPIPSYKPELQSGPLRNPGSVPFVWEHSPGRPKGETKKQKHAKERSPSVPKLPPGRILKPKKQGLDIIKENSNVPKGPRKDSFGSQSVLAKFESSKETKKERSDSRNADGNAATYVDALYTPPRSETFFCSSSVSGVRGLESDGKQSGIRSTGPKTQGFMMGDFLPAAKATASEVPQYAPRKHVTKEKPQEAHKVVNMDNDKPQLTYGPNFLNFTAHDNDEDSDLDYDEHGNMSYNVCGLLPHFCLKGSIGLLNPVPGLSMRTRLSSSPANRTLAGSPSASSQPPSVAVYERKSLVKHQKDQSVLQNESTEATDQKSCQKLEGSGVYNRLQGHGMTNNLTESSPPPISERKEVNSQKKGLVSFKKLLADENEKETDPRNPIVEKTLYVDTVHKVETTKSNSHSSSRKGQSNFNKNDASIFESVNIASESLQLDLLADRLKQDRETEIQRGCCKDPKADQESYARDHNLLVSRRRELEMPAPPPLPKSPSDSWLWRTLPSVSSKNASLRSNPRYPSSNPAAKLDKNVRSRDSKGLLLPIPET